MFYASNPNISHHLITYLRITRAEKELGDLTRAQDPSVLFIAETWTDEARLQKIKRNLQFDHMFFVPRVTLGGGLVLFWKDSLNLNVETSSKNHIDCIIDKGKEDA